MVKNRKNNETRRLKRLAQQASGVLPKTKKTKLEKKEKQLQTSTVENDLLFDPPEDADGELLHNDSNGNSLSGLEFDFDGIDNKENDYSNSSKCKAYILLITEYRNCYIINYFFDPQITNSSRSTIVECKGK